MHLRALLHSLSDAFSWTGTANVVAILALVLGPLASATAFADTPVAMPPRDVPIVLQPAAVKLPPIPSNYLVRDEGSGKRATARALSFGVNGAGLAAMVAVFAQTGGLSGGEVAVAGGTSAVSQKVLEAVFGDSAVRQLADRARQDLLARVAELLAAERARYDDLVRSAVPSPDTSRGLRVALSSLTVARRP